MKLGLIEENAFQQLKHTLTTAPILACPDFTRRFILQIMPVHAEAFGTMLIQHQEHGERVIAFTSRIKWHEEKLQPRS